MTLPVGPADSVAVREQSTLLSGERDPDAGTYTAYPLDADQDDVLAAWLTVDEDVVCDLEEWV